MVKTHIKSIGFADERHVLVPATVLNRAPEVLLARDLVPAAIGHFPHSAGHLVRRAEGIGEYILIYCAAGSGWCRMQGRSWRVESDQVLVIPPGTPHAYGTTKRRPWSIYWVHFRGARADDYAQALGVQPDRPIMNVSKAGEMIYHFESLYSHVRHGYGRQALASLSTALAHFLGELALNRQLTPTTSKTTIDAVQQTIAFMRQNLSRALAVAELAGIAGLSESHYYSRFKEMTGYPPMSFFLRMKMEEAASLLRTSNHQVKEIARLLGYEDPLYFSRQFRQYAGVPPTTYRQRSRS